ncbi:MAG: MotA/TolQ/ExbB proton channel family protein [Candidatus Nitrotoga sp.]
MFAIIEAAGWPIWFLLIASIIALGLIGERLYTLRYRAVIPANLLNNVIQDITTHGVNDEMLARLAADSPLGRIFAAGLKNVKNSPEVMKASIEETGRIVAHDLSRFLTALGTIASISPLLGLFGTMVGMIEIFGAQSATESAPAALAHGISIALYNTAFGLIVAIPSMIFYRHFRAQVNNLTIEMEQQAVKLVEIIHGTRLN